MKIQTFSVVIGTAACDGNCPYCISHITGFQHLPGIREVNWRNFKKAVRLARMGETTTLLFTSKGESTLYPEEITRYLKVLHKELNDPFPFIELQTNAIRIGTVASKLANDGIPGNKLTPTEAKLHDSLHEWYDLGLTTIAISVVDVDDRNNKKIYLNHKTMEYPDLATTVEFLQNIGFSVRLCVMMQKYMVEDFAGVARCAQWCKDHDIAQLTVRPIRKPDREPITEQELYIKENALSPASEHNISEMIAKEGTHIHTIMNGAHEAKIYDLYGQNLCMADCLTIEPASDNIRTLIFYSDGRLFYDWVYPGARLL